MRFLKAPHSGAPRSYWSHLLLGSFCLLTAVVLGSAIYTLRGY